MVLFRLHPRFEKPEYATPNWAKPPQVNSPQILPRFSGQPAQWRI